MTIPKPTKTDMATLTIRNLEDTVVDRLKKEAQANHRSLEAEVRDVLTRAVERPSRRELRALADEIAAMTPKDVVQTDSTLLIREDRDR